MNKYSLKYVGCPIKKRNYRWVLAKSSLLSKPNPRLRLSSLAFSIRSTLILYLLTMSTIDSVTTNFLALLASSCYRWRCFGTWETYRWPGLFASLPNFIFREKFGPINPTNPLLSKTTFNAFEHWRRRWRFKRKKIGTFLFSFDNLWDKNKVLRGGAWSFDKAPVCLENYNGLKIDDK